jgi:hypothetical protein
VLTPGGYLQVKTYAVNNSSGHTFYVMAADGSATPRILVDRFVLCVQQPGVAKSITAATDS